MHQLNVNIYLTNKKKLFEEILLKQKIPSEFMIISSTDCRFSRTKKNLMRIVHFLDRIGNEV